MSGDRDKVPDGDERDDAPAFTAYQLLYLQRTFVHSSAMLVLPTSMDELIAAQGKLGFKAGVKQVLDHIQSLINQKGP